MPGKSAFTEPLFIEERSSFFIALVTASLIALAFESALDLSALVSLLRSAEVVKAVLEVLPAAPPAEPFLVESFVLMLMS